jgi:hypothetical protein
MPFELTFIFIFLAAALLLFAVSTVILIIWTGQKLRDLLSGTGIRIKGIFDIICLLGVALNFALILPLGLIASIFCKPTQQNR